MRPRVRPFSPARFSAFGKAGERTDSINLSFFLSVLYLSDSKSATIAPSARAWAVSSVAFTFADQEDEPVHGPRFQIAQRQLRQSCAVRRSQIGRASLLRPASSRAAFKSGGRMNQSDLERLAGEFAALGERAQHPIGELDRSPRCALEGVGYLRKHRKRELRFPVLHTAWFRV